ncbi:pyridoxamine 5'-phosphate oxidase family protein [Halorussus gelatinilyticus]|uniref:Pyridoxamine 5'-phosphate oxidase family protein n=1 Tax=Halorussus gelatinilyticus TaxID=2937524 RepID=A0A8U0IJH9_9EURY|nr:pyridoxamine 5'-phosphate oxidase family protein [Halorussus gelatinilyticus]UPW00229.1 pyridoxamine 5'-phosphate oxidase family protein [Halorussus gelatinilyticus]
MTKFTGAWSEREVEEYLRSATVPLRLACHRPDESLWMVALWYRYREGFFECSTWAEADVVTYLRNDAEVAFEVSENHPPYRGVRGNGSTGLSVDEDKGVLRDLLERYLGGTDSELAEWLLSPDREEVRIRVRPRRIHSWDYSDRM